MATRTEISAPTTSEWDRERLATRAHETKARSLARTRAVGELATTGPSFRPLKVCVRNCRSLSHTAGLRNSARGGGQIWPGPRGGPHPKAQKCQWEEVAARVRGSRPRESQSDRSLGEKARAPGRQSGQHVYRKNIWPNTGPARLGSARVCVCVFYTIKHLCFSAPDVCCETVAAFSCGGERKSEGPRELAACGQVPDTTCCYVCAALRRTVAGLFAEII